MAVLYGLVILLLAFSAFFALLGGTRKLPALWYWACGPITVLLLAMSAISHLEVGHSMIRILPPLLLTLGLAALHMWAVDVLPRIPAQADEEDREEMRWRVFSRLWLALLASWTLLAADHLLF